jgi:hypothetical protein
VRQAGRNFIAQFLAAQHRLAFDKSEHVQHKAMDADLAEHQGTGARVVHQTSQRGGDALRAGDTLLNFYALLGVGNRPQFEFEVGENAQQWIIDFVGCAKCQSCQRCVFFVLG